MDDRKICKIAADGRTMILEEELDENYEPTAEGWLDSCVRNTWVRWILGSWPYLR